MKTASLARRIALALAMACTTSLALAADADADWIYTFQAGTGAKAGRTPAGPLLRVGSDLYGTTFWGGAADSGTLYVMKPDGAGWKHQSLFEFPQTSAPDSVGYNPAGGLVQGPDGAFYGMTTAGARFSNGAIYRVAPQSGGRLKVTLVHAFEPGSEGSWPTGELAFDAQGNAYGQLANTSGLSGAGALFELQKTARGSVLRIVHSFGQSAVDGCNPRGRLALAADGRLFGITANCGANGYGTVYEVSGAGGTESYRVIHDFEDRKSVRPSGGLSIGPAGVLFDTTEGYAFDSRNIWNPVDSTIFRMAPAGNGYDYADIASFDMGGGTSVIAPVDVDAAGRVTGITASGRLFRLEATPGGSYTQTTLGDMGAQYDVSVQYGVTYTADGRQAIDSSVFAGDIDKPTAFAGGLFAVPLR